MNRMRLVVAVAVVLAAFGASKSAGADTSVATLSGEQLSACHAGLVGTGGLSCGVFGDTGPLSVRIRARCTDTQNGTVTWTASGNAFGPYPGTFTETGSFVFVNGLLTQVEVTFHIDSVTADVDGRKFLLLPASGSCAIAPSSGGFEIINGAIVRYEAVIKPTTGGSFGDEGISYLNVIGFTATDPFLTEAEATIAVIGEGFTSDLLFAPPLLPDAKEQCKDEGFLIFGVFENQGDCVSFVSTDGKNEPGKNQPGGS